MRGKKERNVLKKGGLDRVNTVGRVLIFNAANAGQIPGIP